MKPGPKLRRRASLLVWFGGIAFALSLLAGLVFWEKKTKAEDGTKEFIYEVKRKTLAERLLLTGEVLPVQLWEIRPEVSGKIKKILVVPGDEKKKGELLALIDDSDLQTERARAQQEVEGAEIELEKIQANFTRLQQLFQAKLASIEAYENLKADLALAKNRLARAKSNLQTVEDRIRKTQIVAPADGKVLEVKVKEGDVVVGATSVNSGTVLLLFADMSQFLLRFHANQMDRIKLREGQKVICTLPGKQETIEGSISFISPFATVQNEIRGFSVEAILQKNKDNFYPGISVNVEIPIETRENALSVPISAVHFEENKAYVYIKKGNEFEKREIELGLADEFAVEVKKGLADGEQIVLEPPSKK